MVLLLFFFSFKKAGESKPAASLIDFNVATQRASEWPETMTALKSPPAIRVTNPQSGELSLHSNMSAHEWKEKNGRQKRHNFVPYCKDVCHLTSGAHWKPECLRLHRQEKVTSWGRAKGKARLSHLFPERSIPQALPGPTLQMLTRRLTLNLSKWLNCSSLSFFLPPPFYQ